MKSIVKDFKNNKIIHYIILLLCTVVVALQLKDFVISYTHDGKFHLLKLIGTALSIKDGQFPSLVFTKYCNNGGYPMNVFYPCLTTYIPLLIKIFVKTYEHSLKIFAGLTIFLSSISMYKMTEEIIDKKSSLNGNKRLISLFAGVFYMIFPYKLSCIYIRFALGEFTSFIFIPLVFLGLYNILYSDGKKHYYLTIGAAGLLLTHTITTVYTAILAGILLVINLKSLKQKEVLKKICINGFFTVMIGLMFIVPLLEYKLNGNYMIFNSDLMRTNLKSVSQNTINANQLFEQKRELSGPYKYEGEEEVGIVEARLTIPIILLMISTVFIYKKISKKQGAIYLIFFVFGVISMLMCLNTFPWNIMPSFTAVIQYPWRLLGFFILFISPVCAINLFLLIELFIKNQEIKNLISVMVIILLLLYTKIIILPNYYQEKNRLTDYYCNYEKDVLTKKTISHLQINRDYLPVKCYKGLTTYLKTRDENKIYILEGEAQILNEQKDGLNMTFDIINGVEGSVLEFPYYYYPGYQIIIKDEEGAIIGDVQYGESENGYITIKLTQDIIDSKVKIEYKGTFIEKASYFISIISIVVFIFYVIKEVTGNEHIFKTIKK